MWYISFGPAKIKLKLGLREGEYNHPTSLQLAELSDALGYRSFGIAVGEGCPFSWKTVDPVSFNLLLFLFFFFCFKMTEVVVLEKRINRRKNKAK